MPEVKRIDRVPYMRQKQMEAKKKPPSKRRRRPKGLHAQLIPLKPRKIRWYCRVKGCRVKRTGHKTSRWCAEHLEQIRKMQMAAASVRCYQGKKVTKRRKEPHVWYRDKPTRWAMDHPTLAIKLVRDGRTTLVDAEEFAVVLRQAIEERKVTSVSRPPQPRRRTRQQAQLPAPE